MSNGDKRNSASNGYNSNTSSPSGVCAPARPNDQDQKGCPRPLSSPLLGPYYQEPVSTPGPGFYVVPYSMTAKDMFDTLFENIPNSALRKFSDLNPELDSYIKAGTMIVLSDLPSTICTPEETKLMSTAREVKAALEPLTPEEADFMYRYRAEIELIVSGSSTWMGVSSAMVEQHLDEIRKTLLEIERLHQDTYRKHGKLRSPEFHSARNRLLDQLDAQFLKSARLRNLTSFGNYNKLKTSLGISSRSLVHHWGKAGGPGQIPGYATHVNSISSAAKYMKAGGYVGIFLGGVAGGLRIMDVCNAAPDSSECKRIKFTEGGKFTGSVVGGIAGGAGGGFLAGKVCFGIGAVTGGSGGVVCGVIVVVGTGIGAWLGGVGVGNAGESVGEAIYETTLP